MRRWKDPGGAWRDGKTYWVLFYVAGRRFHESLGTKDKRAAELIAADRLRRAELTAAGIVDPYQQHVERALKEHVDDFEATLRGRNVVEKCVADRIGCLGAYRAYANAERLRDLDLPSASRWVTALEKQGLPARSVNGRLRALKQFGRWLVATRSVVGCPPRAWSRRRARPTGS
jgi:hypothetical protein